MKRKYEKVEPKTQRLVVKEYQSSVRAKSMSELGELFDLHKSTVHAIIVRARHNDGDPVTRRGHKKRKLNSDDERKLQVALDQNPLATNRELAAVVNNNIAPRTVTDYLRRATPIFTSKVIVNQEPEELTDDWKKQAKGWIRKVRKVPLNNHLYVDETGIYGNQAPKKGRSRRGKRIFRPKSKYAKKYSLHVEWYIALGIE
jgi:hypothetical protein